EQLRRTSSSLFLEGDIALAPESTARTQKRSHASAYAELGMPLSPKFDVNIAGRLDHADRYGNRFSPQAGFKWQLGQGFILRGSAGYGYRTPSLYELRAPLDFTEEATLALEPGDPPCAVPGWEDDECSLIVVPMETPDLRPETSKSHTLGIAWSPAVGLDINLDHYRIVRRQEIQQTNPNRPRDHP